MAPRKSSATTNSNGAGVAPGKTAAEIVAHSEGGPDRSRVQRIRLAAYRRAEARGFEPGAELEDWLAAEAEVDAQGLL